MERRIKFSEMLFVLLNNKCGDGKPCRDQIRGQLALLCFASEQAAEEYRRRIIPADIRHFYPAKRLSVGEWLHQLRDAYLDGVMHLSVVVLGNDGLAKGAIAIDDIFKVLNWNDPKELPPDLADGQHRFEGFDFRWN